MGTRTTLTKNLALEIMKSRKSQGLSQYELADKLGWVRSKIKRLEKGEVLSIAEEDLAALARTLRWGRGISSSAPTASSKTVKSANASSFKLLGPVSRVRTKLKYFRVEFLHPVKVRELLGLQVAFPTARGAIHGIEHTTKQGRIFEKGEQTIIAVYPST